MKSKPTDDNLFAYTNLPHLELVGNGRCMVDGLKGITEYNRERIKMNLGKYSVCFIGSELSINAFSPEGAVVEGDILSVEFAGNA